MEKEKQLWQRIYQEPAFTEVARIIGYAGTTYRDLMEKVEPLKQQYGGRAIDSAIYFLASFEGDRSSNVKPLAAVSLRQEARKLCWQLLGVPPDHKETSVADMLGLNREAKPEPPKEEPKAARAKKPRSSKKKTGEPAKPTEGPPATSKTSVPEGGGAIMAQYRAAKEKHPDMLLVFRIGDFYELFDADAVKASKILGLTLTSRDKQTMAGFPHHALETYLHKLLKEGCRVAICDQVDSADGKSIKREVQRVVAPPKDTA